MKNTKLRSAFYWGIALLLCVISINGFAVGQTTLVSVGTGGVKANNESFLGFPKHSAISANGRFVAFQSAADNLVAGDTNKDNDLFVHDRLTNQTIRVNVASNGDQTPLNTSTICSGCIRFALSADGRFVAFDSKANNLVAGDTNSMFDIFVHDRLTKQTTRVNVNSKGEQAAAQLYGSFSPAISADGRYVAFQSDADNLVAGDTNSTFDIFVHDRQTKQTTRVNVNSNGRQAVLGSSDAPSISADGRYVVFDSFADNLVAGDTNFGYDVFVHDRQTKQTTLVNVNSKGEQAFDTMSFAVPSAKISADGRFVVFHSFAENLVPDDTNFAIDVFVRDLKTHQTTRVSVDSNNAQGTDWSLDPDISADGRYVVFESSSNLVANVNGGANFYIHDRWSHQTSLISVGLSGQASGSSSQTNASISADGRYVVFEDWGNLVTGDTNFLPDVFVRDRKLITANPTDLQIAVTQKPSTIVRNSQGSYTYTITNNGQNPAYTTITHLVSNGEVVGFTPAKGKCNSYASISFCNLDLLLPGASVTLDVSVKALRTPVSQQLTLASGGRDDPNKTNNYLNVNTPVTP